jgi:dihydroflavonol-4-reductase
MIVITGASGMIGGNLVRALLPQGRPIRALVHQDRRALEGLYLETIPADVTNAASLQQAFTGAKTVYHLASSISIRMDNWSELEQVNIAGTRNVIDACLHCGVSKLVYFSSIHAYRQAPFDLPLNEERPLLTGSQAPPYERSKAAAEVLARQAPDRGLATVIVIPTAIIGPYDFRPSYQGQALQMLAKGRIPALVRGGYDWVDVRDVVSGTIQAERLGASGSRYILSGYWRSLTEIAQLTSDLTGKPAPRLVVPIWLADLFQPVMEKLAQVNSTQPLYTKAMLKAMRSNRMINHDRAASDLGYAPRPFEETLGDTLDWFASQGKEHP